MPVSKLYVEGKLDNEIYAALFAGVPPVVRDPETLFPPQLTTDH